MKTNYIFSFCLLLILSSSAMAQLGDLAVTWNHYKDGQTASGSSVKGQFTITNKGVTTFAAGDSILASYIVMGVPYTWNDDGELIPGYARILVLAEDLVPGDSLMVEDVDELFIFGNTGSAITCVGVAPTTRFFDGTYVDDANPSDNQSCFRYLLTSVEEDLQAIANAMYVADKQLKIVNNSASFNTLAAIKIINLTGQVIKAENLVLSSGTTSIDLNHLPKGIYVASIKIGTNLSTKKIFVQ